MRYLGIRFHAISTKRRVLRAVVVDDTGALAPACLEHVLDGSASQAQQARDGRDWLRSALAGHPDIAAAVMFEADRGPRSSDTNAGRLRLRVEGAVLSGALDHVNVVEIRNGKRIGDLIGGTKDAALALGALTVADASYTEAAAAALAAVKLA
ncbi:hypothetical protein ACPW96_17910 [Micromonospora sp. DT81.3]|uniref:hypothetical protein n=1 Tax=Micromonospora sp. DT81.3 TaxID=3416523 RepID=UPI003CF54B86